MTKFQPSMIVCLVKAPPMLHPIFGPRASALHFPCGILKLNWRFFLNVWGIDHKVWITSTFRRNQSSHVRQIIRFMKVINEPAGFLSIHPSTGTIPCAERWCCLSSLLGYWEQSWMGRHSDRIPANWHSFCRPRKDDRQRQPHLV